MLNEKELQEMQKQYEKATNLSMAEEFEELEKLGIIERVNKEGQQKYRFVKEENKINKWGYVILTLAFLNAVVWFGVYLT